MKDDKYEIFISTLGADLLRELLAIFETQFCEGIVELDKNMREENYKKASTLAHMLKSSAKNVGAYEIGEIFHHIEKNPEKTLRSECLSHLKVLYGLFREETKTFWTSS